MSTKKEWEADIPISIKLVKGCVEKQFPLLCPIKTITCIGEGWDNKVFLINQKIIFRFPRRKVAVALIERENALLKNLQGISAVNIPCPCYFGCPTSEFPYPFHGYMQLEGISACYAHLTQQNRMESLPMLTQFLKQLHYIGEREALDLGAQPQVFDRTTVSRTIQALKVRVDKLIDGKLEQINKACFQHEINLVEKIRLPEDKCLVHGDLDARHLLFHENKLTGIIDWGDTGISHKAVDLAVLWSFYPPQFHAEFLNLYGEVDSDTWQYARFLGLYSALTLMLYGYDKNDVLLVKESAWAVNHINPELLTL